MERKKNKFELLADKVTQWSGSSYVFGIATGLIIAWLFCDIRTLGNWSSIPVQRLLLF